MSITVTGKVEHRQLGLGTWALVAQGGETYELKDPPEELQQSGIEVEVKGQVRDDIMTVAMIGKVLEVQSFEVLQ